jgi:hypothetical protein
VGSEFFINSQELEDKVRQLLPSQGGAGAGFDLSASTQIIPIIDLTESAEGSNLREDLQSSFSLTSITHTETTNATKNLVTNTGYFRVYGTVTTYAFSDCRIELTDGTTTKKIFNFSGGNTVNTTEFFDFNVLLQAGDILRAVTTNTSGLIYSTTRQIATIDGILVNP